MREFLVEVTPGREVLYRTPVALGAAIRSGDITADSLIFHRATSSWVAITEHPEYRKIQAELDPPPGLDPPQPSELMVPPPARHRRGVLGSLAGIGAALATVGWASIKKHIDSGATRPVRPAKPLGSLKAVSSIQPGQPAPKADPQRPTSGRDSWTFYA